MKRRLRLAPADRMHAGLSRSRIGPTYPLPPIDWTLGMVRAVLAAQSEVARRMAAEALA